MKKINIEDVKKAYVSYIQKDKIKKLPFDDPYSSTPFYRFVCVDDNSNCFIVLKGYCWDSMEHGEISFPCKSKQHITEIFQHREIGKSKRTAIENYVAIKNNRVPFDYDIYEYWSSNEIPLDVNKFTSDINDYFKSHFTSQDLDKVLSSYPNLTGNGFDQPNDKDFSSSRQYLQNGLEEFQRSCVYLSRRRKEKTFNMGFSSYGLKHMVERQFGAYISNGVLIAAGLHLGFEHTVFGPNAFFKMSQQEFISNEEI